jgi:type III secretion protein L
VLRERTPQLMQLIGRSVDLAIKDDPDVEAGGCVIQTEFGTVDAQLTTQLQMLRNVLLPDDAKREGPQ